MTIKAYEYSISKIVERLSQSGAPIAEDLQKDVAPPLRERVGEILEVAKAIIFPGFFGKECAIRTRTYFVGMKIDMLHSLLTDQIARALQYEHGAMYAGISEQSQSLAMSFVESLPDIKRMLYTDVQAIYENDPAVDNYGEIVASYPVVQAMIHYRVAHRLLKLGVPVLPRIITELAHSSTGIDIHPGASIGEYFAIDHGTGVVIGETCIIGHHVTLYQGVTLGAKNFSYNSQGHPINLPRHPIIEDYVTVYSNSSILGRITIGHHSVIGGNVWLTHDVAPNSQILQSTAITSFTDGLGI